MTINSDSKIVNIFHVRSRQCQVRNVHIHFTLPQIGLSLLKILELHTSTCPVPYKKLGHVGMRRTWVDVELIDHEFVYGCVSTKL